jgi:CDP-glucose 4,6-dehydratase
MSGTVQPDFGCAFAGARVLVTGHTGFKGGWLSTWLVQLGARVTGISLLPEPGPSFFEACALGTAVDSRIADITSVDALRDAAGELDAELVIHMAAQSLVRRSYRDPAGTLATNVVGTAHVLDLARRMPSLRAIIVVTSDKCYDNREWAWGYRENDPLGGADPYSASKGATELVAHAYRRSFFDDPAGPQLASVRAGNVFGGGDWAEDRLVPDIVRSVAAGEAVHVRNPDSVRPWQHVLEPLSGYLALASRLMTDGAAFSGAWNFGPDLTGMVTVRALAEMMQEAWEPGGPEFIFADPSVKPANALHEAGLLRLDSTKAQTGLGWRPQLDLRDAVRLTAEWHKAHASGRPMLALTYAQIAEYSNQMASDPFVRPDRRRTMSRGLTGRRRCG